MSHAPNLNLELYTVKYFPKVTENPHRLAEKFNIVIQTNQLHFYLCQLVHVFGGEGQAQHWMKTANAEVLNNL